MQIVGAVDLLYSSRVHKYHSR